MESRSDRGKNEAEQYMRAAEVARLLHVSPKTISRWAKENKLPCVRTLGGHRRFPASAIRELVERLASGSDELLTAGQ